MELTERDFQVLDALDRHEITTQRQLADHAGISLGKVNYVLKSLLDRGLVKLGNYRRNPHKVVSYAYLLTPKGIEEKSRLAVRFVINRLNEYDRLRQIFTEKLSAISRNGHKRIIIVGPRIIREFLVSIINEEHRQVNVIAQCDNGEDLRDTNRDSYDVVLWFADTGGNAMEIAGTVGIPKHRVISLW